MLLRVIVASVVLALLPDAGEAQTLPSAPAPAKTVAKKPNARKPAAKVKSSSKRSAAVESGPCRLGVVSALGDRFSVHKFGLTVFETEDNEIPVVGWGFDELAVARVRAATGNSSSVRRINYPRGAFDPYYHPKSRFLPDPGEGLPAIIRNITQTTKCQRYLVITTFKGAVAGTKMEINGIGVYSRGIGSLVRHSYLFANIAVTLFDGVTYERINPSFASVGSSLSRAFQLTEDPLTKLDHSLFPDPPGSASTSTALKERTRALVSAQLDRVIPGRLAE